MPFLSTNTSAECSALGRLGRGSTIRVGVGGTQAPTSTRRVPLLLMS